MTPVNMRLRKGTARENMTGTPGFCIKSWDLLSVGKEDRGNLGALG